MTNLIRNSLDTPSSSSSIQTMSTCQLFLSHIYILHIHGSSFALYSLDPLTCHISYQFKPWAHVNCAFFISIFFHIHGTSFTLCPLLMCLSPSSSFCHEHTKCHGFNASLWHDLVALILLIYNTTTFILSTLS